MIKVQVCVSHQFSGKEKTRIMQTRDGDKILVHSQ